MRTTTEHIRMIREMNAAGMSDRSIARELGIASSTVWYIRQDYGIGSKRAPRGAEVIIRVVEDGFVGTVTECAKHLGKNTAAMRTDLYRNSHLYKRTRRNRRKQK